MISLSLFFPRLNSPSCEMLIFVIVCCSLSSSSSISLVLRSPYLVPAYQVWPLQCWVEGKSHLPQPAGYYPPNVAQETMGICTFVDSCLSGLQILLWKAAFQLIDPMHILMLGIILPQGQDFALLLFSGSLLSCSAVSLACRYSSGWHQTSGGHTPIIRLLMKILNRAGSSTDLWGTH